MNAEEYMQERVENQISWYDKKSRRAQGWFKTIRTTEILAAGLIPLVAGFGRGTTASTILVGVLGATVAILAALLSLHQFQENWIEYRTTCESLKHEKYLFLTGAEPYNEEGAYGLFVQRVESMVSKENSGWSQYTRAGAKSSKPQGNGT